jgi:hypothetical protein
MPRSFDMSADYQGSVEEVHRTFYDPGYWQGRLAETPVDISSVETILIGGESGTDGTIKVVTVQTVLSQHLPALVTQLHRGDFCVRREETWSPINDGIATASIAGSVVGAPVSIWGTAVLKPNVDTGGAQMTANITVQVRVPFIGGKLERLIGSQIGLLIAIEQRFTSSWLDSAEPGPAQAGPA